MPEIKITVADKVATTQGAPRIVCGNSDYTVAFEFDAEWEEHNTKTARFVYAAGGRMQYAEKLFQGDTCPVPVLSGVTEVYVGVYAGDLRTTTPARIPCQHSILCGDPVHADPPPDVYHQLLEMLEDIQSGLSVNVFGVLETERGMAEGAASVLAMDDTTTTTEEG